MKRQRRRSILVIGLFALAALAVVLWSSGPQAHAAGTGPSVCDPNKKYGGVFVGTDGPTYQVGGGTAEGGSQNTIVDNDADFNPGGGSNEQNGRLVRIKGGPGAGQARYIQANTMTQLTVYPNWSTAPGAGSTYNIHTGQTGSEFDPQRMAKKLHDMCAGGLGGWANATKDVIVENGAPNMLMGVGGVNFNATAPGVEKTEIQNAVNAHKADLLPGDGFMFYISAHGGTNRLVLDGAAGENELLYSELRQLLSGFKASVQITVIIDACNAGSFINWINAGGGIKNDQGVPLDLKHLKVLMAVDMGCNAPSSYRGNDVNSEWYDDIHLVVGMGQESCMGGDGSADGDLVDPMPTYLNDYANTGWYGDPDCLGGVFTNTLRNCLFVGITARDWFTCAQGAIAAMPTPPPPPVQYPSKTPTPSPPPPLGGVAIYPDTSSGANTWVLGGAAAATVALLAAGWYVRRRWLP